MDYSLFAIKLILKKTLKGTSYTLRFEEFEEFEEFERDRGLICLQKQFRTTTLITDLNIVLGKNIKLIEKADLGVSLF